MAKEKPVLWWVRIVVPGSGPTGSTLGYLGKHYDRGELIELQNVPGDEKLIRLAFVAQVETPRLICQCGVCGAEFINETMRAMHGNRRHPARFVPAHMEEDLEVVSRFSGLDGLPGATRDVTGDEEERRMLAEYPPDLTKTKASQEA